jgi:hypothetical protein
MKRTKIVLAAAVLVVSGLALPGSASAAVRTTPQHVNPGWPMLHPLHSACAAMMDEV